MKLVIDIPDKIYNTFHEGNWSATYDDILDYLEQKPCEDCISRQAVIDYAKDTCLDLDKYEDTEVLCDEIKASPSVTPQIEPCEDCISRAEMLKYQQYLHGKMSNEENHKLWEFIKGLPSVTTERPTGKWIKEKGYLLVYRCSNCRKCVYSRESESDEKFEDLSRLDSYKYCPRCGAYIGGGKDEDGD